MPTSFQFKVSIKNAKVIDALDRHINSAYRKKIVKGLEGAGIKVAESVKREYRRQVRHAYGSKTALADVIHAKFTFSDASKSGISRGIRTSKSPNARGRLEQIQTIGSVAIGFKHKTQKWLSIAYQREFGTLIDGSNTIFPKKGKVMAIPPKVKGSKNFETHGDPGDREEGIEARYISRFSDPDFKSEVRPGIFGGQIEDQYNLFSQKKSPRDFKGHWRRSAAGNIVFIREVGKGDNRKIQGRRETAYGKMFGAAHLIMADGKWQSTGYKKKERVVRRSSELQGDGSRGESVRIVSSSGDHLAQSRAKDANDLVNQLTRSQQVGISKISDLGQATAGNEHYKMHSPVIDPASYTKQQQKLNMTFDKGEGGELMSTATWNRSVTVYERQAKSKMSAKAKASNALQATQHVRKMTTDDKFGIIRWTEGKKQKHHKLPAGAKPRGSFTSFEGSNFTIGVHSSPKQGKYKGDYQKQRSAHFDRVNAQKTRDLVKKQAGPREKWLRERAMEMEEPGAGEVLFIGKQTVKVPSYAESPKFLRNTLFRMNVEGQIFEQMLRLFKEMGLSIHSAGSTGRRSVSESVSRLMKTIQSSPRGG